jgi:Clr5 domain
MLAFSSAAANIAASEHKWTLYKETIYDLYIKQNKTLNEVIEQMDSCYGFDARWVPTPN